MLINFVHVICSAHYKLHALQYLLLGLLLLQRMHLLNQDHNFNNFTHRLLATEIKFGVGQVIHFSYQSLGKSRQGNKTGSLNVGKYEYDMNVRNMYRLNYYGEFCGILMHSVVTGSWELMAPLSHFCQIVTPRLWRDGGITKFFSILYHQFHILNCYF